MQQRLVAMHPGAPFSEHIQSTSVNAYTLPDDALSDDMMDNTNPILLPNPDLGNLTEVENIMRAASATAAGREALAKFIMAPDSLYIPKLLPLVEMAEDLEDIDGLHKLCNIMKTLILLNDTSIIECAVSDQAILGVVGALECMSICKTLACEPNANHLPQMTPTSPLTRPTTGSSSQTDHVSRK